MKRVNSRKIKIINPKLANLLEIDVLPITISDNSLIKIIEKQFHVIIIYWIKRYDTILNWMRNDFTEIYWNAILFLFNCVLEVNCDSVQFQSENKIEQFLHGKLKYFMKSQKNARMKKQEYFERTKNSLSSRKIKNLLWKIKTKQEDENIFVNYEKMSPKMNSQEKQFVEHTLQIAKTSKLPYIKKENRIILSNIRNHYNNTFVFT
ncbi:hypothetical protein C4M96_02800 [Mycoplasmopsis pullorum]|uniref:hypothetical protein n=1 Tax=Mycoplasmopsis pullorum TaxID=48003 RepID=UPI001118C9BA|nr:hypothetical protein [Mycoplasmopsis pullorum]TNK83807.1 hypothetical protein C4M93_01020 [Mycoplasmopsis pullorum]TNK91960.1 hypothetical protein C4M96_02800 [Mycoplasmopsis pullorum]